MRSVRIQRFVVVLLLLALAAGAFTLGRLSVPGEFAVALAQLNPGVYQEVSDNPIPPDLNPLQLFWDVRDHIIRNYVYSVEDQQKLTYGAIKGMINSLDDPYSSFMTPQEYQDFVGEQSGKFDGIGARLTREAGEEGKPARIIVESVIPEGPALDAGLLGGDVILAVDGKPLLDMGLNEAVQLIRGPAGEPVKLLLLREGEEAPLEITIVRRHIDFPNVESKVLEGDIGYLWLRQFNSRATDEVKVALEGLLQKDIKGLVFDLSGDGGGLLDQAIGVTSLFLEDGPVVWVQERGKEPQALNAQGKASFPPDLPIVVLVDHYSASASEIAAAALREHGRAKLVGQSTYGKAKVQTVIRLRDNSALKLSTAVYLTPNQHDISKPWPEDQNKRGLRPDLQLPEYDPQTKLRSDVWHEQQVEAARKYVQEILDQSALVSAAAAN